MFLLRGTNSIQQDYLFHVLRSEETQRTIRRLITGSAQPGLNRDFLKATWVFLPPLDDQRRIAEILDAIDETIRATERVIAKHKQIRSGLASDLLTGKNELLSAPAPINASRGLGMSEPRDQVTIGELADLNPESLGANTASDRTFKYIGLFAFEVGVGGVRVRA